MMSTENLVNPVKNLVNPVKRLSGILVHPTSFPGPYGFVESGLETSSKLKARLLRKVAR
jgi:hypothetical protein